jgi:hypothetical protein
MPDRPHQFAPAGFYALMRHIGIETAHGRRRPELAEEMVREMAPYIAPEHRGDCVGYLLHIAEQWRLNEIARLEKRNGAIRRILWPLASARIPLQRLREHAYETNNGVLDDDEVEAIIVDIIAATRYAWKKIAP